MIYFNDRIVEKYVALALTNPEAPFTFNSVKIKNLKCIYDFVAEKCKKDVVFDEVLKEVINLDGCYELPKWMTKSGNPECIYFERKDNIDKETYDVETIIIF